MHWSFYVSFRARCPTYLPIYVEWNPSIGLSVCLSVEDDEDGKGCLFVRSFYLSIYSSDGWIRVSRRDGKLHCMRDA